MIIHTINFEIRFDMMNLTEEEYAEVMDTVMKEMKEKHPNGIPFEELLEIIPLDKFKFHPTSIQYPDLEYHDNNSVVTKETKIEIRA